MFFTKMHGTGNDFIILDGFRQPVILSQAQAARLCDRHYGIGADGVILALPSSVAEARMRVFNRDGSEAEMCGNGLRCLGKYLLDAGHCVASPLRVETGAGILALTAERGADGLVERLTVDMGAPRFTPEDIPVLAPANRIALDLEGRQVTFFCVSMGNPHAVTFDLYPDEAAFMRLGPLVERHPTFPRRTNVEFCRLEGTGAKVRVWERGDGPTLACGTGACAVLAAGARLGLLGQSAPIRLPGGELFIRLGDDGHLFMTGEAKTVF
ncbi:MAG: diaminopimelate epimerase, partial [Clostridia bacterium]|nr:diaminopimelate epimerase [Clostridia bacterium]